MRVLLDENLPRKLAHTLSHIADVSTVVKQGWQGTKNGALLRLAEQEFDVFVTMDRGIPYQLDVDNFKIGIVVITAVSNRYEELAPLKDRIANACVEAKDGKLLRVGA